MAVSIAGSWKLRAWCRFEGDKITYPFGDDATGVLVYVEDGTMAVQMTAAHRPTIPTIDALGGDAEQRAAAYSTCLAYFGTWEVRNNEVIHHIEASLFPNWSGTDQPRPFNCDGQKLVLRTQPDSNGVVNEIIWER